MGSTSGAGSAGDLGTERAPACPSQQRKEFNGNKLLWTPYPPTLIKHLKYYYSNETSNEDLRFDYVSVQKLKKILFNNMKHQIGIHT